MTLRAQVDTTIQAWLSDALDLTARTEDLNINDRDSWAFGEDPGDVNLYYHDTLSFAGFELLQLRLSDGSLVDPASGQSLVFTHINVVYIRDPRDIGIIYWEFAKANAWEGADTLFNAVGGTSAAFIIHSGVWYVQNRLAAVVTPPNDIIYLTEGTGSAAEIDFVLIGRGTRS